ncbi:hypothetical protein LMG26411_08223 [Cupriavidus numazuensis]|uniref:Uncharacterized protein n=1 Tax=Cupriavidus numazuensis TaxID=221992 RepID=A0ABM8TWZ2_9BURK|nr:hypothetical protein LMG26411_08223 [Cupriavidus numazuensis]
MGNSPPNAQAFEQHGREHRVAVLATLALFDAQGHALTVDIGHLQRHHFAGAQAGAIGDRERGLVLQVPSGRQQSADFVGTEYHGQGAWNSYRSHLGHALRIAERHFKEELQSGDRGIERNRGDAVIDQMELIAS